MTELNESTREPSKNLSFLQTCSLNKGIKQFGERGRKAALKEMKQLHDKACFEPIDKKTFGASEAKRALDSSIFLPEEIPSSRCI